MSSLDLLREFAESREHDAVLIRDGISYGNVRETLRVMAELEAELQAGRDLMAVVHRDGGDYRQTHGDRKAADDAIAIVSKLRVDLDAERERREAAEAELAAERARSEAFAKLLAGIHALLYPPPIKMGDGRAMLFRPQNLDPHAVLQELSDRIRALPDELADFGPKRHKD